MNERRKERLASFVRDAMSEFFLRDAAFAPGVLVSVVYVEVNDALSKANVYVSVYPDEARGGVAEKLKVSENEAKHFVRTHLRTKYSPTIHFFVR